MFIILFTLASCKDDNYRTFTFYNIQSSEGNVPSVLLSEYKNTKYDIYETKLVYHDGFNSRTYKYKFNNGYLEVTNQKDVTYQIKDDKLYVDIKTVKPVKLEIKEFNLTQLLIDNIERVKSLSNLEIIFEHQENIMIHADELKISQVFYNILNNALSAYLQVFKTAGCSILLVII